MFDLCRLVIGCQLFGKKHAVSVLRADENCALKVETVCLSETLASTDDSTRRQNHRFENLNFHIHLVCFKSDVGNSDRNRMNFSSFLPS